MTAPRNGFFRIAFAALAAFLDWLTGCAIRASDAFIALARRKGIAARFGKAGARICIATAEALGRASDRAGKVAFPASRA